MALEDPIVSERLTSFFQEFVYLGPFTVLLLCGVGLPLPEEVTLLGSGILVQQQRADFWVITAVCSIAILLGDSIPYWLGRRYGMGALRIRWVAKILHPERFALLQTRFEEHGAWAVFSCRFLPGIRIPGYFTAGTLRMPYLQFLLLDAIGVLISVPISVHLGEILGGNVDRLQNEMGILHQILALGIVGILITLWVRARIRKRAEASELLPKEGAALSVACEGGPETSPDAARPIGQDVAGGGPGGVAGGPAEGRPPPGGP